MIIDFNEPHMGGKRLRRTRQLARQANVSIPRVPRLKKISRMRCERLHSINGVAVVLFVLVKILAIAKSVEEDNSKISSIDEMIIAARSSLIIAEKSNQTSFQR